MSDRFMLKLLAHQLLSVINFWCTRDVARPIHLVQHHTVEKKALSLAHKKPLTVILVVFVLAPVTIGVSASDEEEREEQTYKYLVNICNKCN